MKNLLLMLVAMSALTMSALAMAAVNVNTADAEALSELPYIGEAKSAAIIEEREAHGDFESVDDLTRVSGIGSATVDRIRDQVTVDASTATTDGGS
ncbi:ComEA family DNA-binding protein [uncultured Salinisphaera sp.]|jgi:competence protein ComEA|uniref:ComEA family DNA-binding protein n=1 Tax=uncultured Salinisphaera sp. TaxID=359372 RepID=UPI0032B120AD